MLEEIKKIYSIDGEADFFFLGDRISHSQDMYMVMVWGDSPDSDRFYKGDREDVIAAALGFEDNEDFQDYISSTSDPEEAEELAERFNEIDEGLRTVNLS